MIKSHPRHFSLCCSLAAAVCGALALPVGAQDADPAAEDMAAHCRQMKERQDRMLAQVKAQDAKLNELVATMNSATPDQKVNAIAAVVTQLVNQRVAMHSKMEQLRDEKMQHLMEHMGKKGSIDQCPANKASQPPALKPE